MKKFKTNLERHQGEALTGGLLLVSALMLVFTQESSGATVSWNKTIDYSLDNSAVITYVGATTGTTTGPTVNGVQLGYDLLSTGNQRDTLISPTVWDVFASPSSYVEMTLKFDHLLSGGSLAQVTTLQYVTNYDISISGGTGTLTNAGVQYHETEGTIDPQGTYSGDGTSTIHFVAPGTSANAWTDNYTGGQGLLINGTFDTVTIRRWNTDFSPGALKAWDDVAGLTVSGATVVVVPEPSGVLLFGASGLLAVFRRRRPGCAS